MDESQARQLIDRYWQALNTRNFDDIRDLFADDVYIEWPQSGERFHGKEACIAVFENYPGGSPQGQKLNRVMGSGDLWVIEADAVYPDGKKYIVVGLYEMRDGKLAHEIDYFSEPFEAPEWRKGMLPAE